MRRVLAVFAAFAAMMVPAAAAATRPEVLAQTGITPGPHFFGDRVGAELDVFIDPDRVDPRSVRVDMTFDPYTVVTRSRSSRSADGTTELVYRAELSCLVAGCVPTGTEQKIQFPRATVSFRRRTGTRGPLLAASWPSFRLVARAPKKSISQTGLVFGLGGGGFDPNTIFHTPTFPPPPSYRMSPLALGLLLLGLATMALVGAALLSRPFVGLARMRLAARAAKPSVTPLEAALERVRASADDRPGTSEHREALARLARELAGVGLRDLVRPATRLAWSSADPTRDESLELMRHVRERVNGSNR
jgi:hypothetical protein